MKLSVLVVPVLVMVLVTSVVLPLVPVVGPLTVVATKSGPGGLFMVIFCVVACMLLFSLVSVMVLYRSA